MSPANSSINPPPPVSLDETVLVCAPFGRDNSLACRLLDGSGVAARACSNIDALCERLSPTSGAVLITQEALQGDGARRFASALREQPQGVDIPVLALIASVQARRADAVLQGALETVDNLTLIPRPIASAALLDLVCAALRARRRRRETRDRFDPQAICAQAHAASPLPVFLVSAGTVSYANAAALSLVGVAEARQCVGLALDQWMRPDFIPLLADCATRLMSELQSVAVMEQVWVRADGTPVNTEVTLCPVTWGARTDLLVFVRDVTRIARTMEELHRQVDDLASSNQRKDEFIAVLAHELRNPLAPIQNAVHVLKIQPDPPDPKHYRWATETIARQAHHLTRLIDDLLDMARIAHGRVELHKELVQLDPLLSQAIESIRPLTGARRQTITYSAPIESIRLEADPTRLAQVVGNLLGNASRYTPIGGHIALEARQEGHEAVVTVTDTGIGIPASALVEIFEPFRQGLRPPDYARAGLGLGLALVQRLVDLHGGSVRAESAGSGRGSTFTVRLPALPRLESTDEAVFSRSVEAAKGWRILVVDDDDEVVPSFAVMLSAMGHEVRAAATSVAALTSVRTFDPQLVFLGVDVPAFDAYTLAEALRRSSQRPELRLVALAAHDDEATRRRAAGFAAYLLKPVTPDTVQTLLASLRS